MLIILKKPSENYEETFKCDYIERKTELNTFGVKEVFLRFRLIETKFEKDDKESIYGYIPYNKENDSQYEAKNTSLFLDLKFQEPSNFDQNSFTLIEILKRLNEYNDVDKMVLEQTDNDDMIITLHPGLLEYRFRLWECNARVW